MRRETSLHKEKFSPLSGPPMQPERWRVYHSGKWWMQDSFFFLSILLRYNWYITLIHFQFSSVAQSCPTLCDLMDCNRPGHPVHHQLPKSCPLSRWCHPIISSSVVPFSLCPQSFQHQGLFKWVSSSYKVDKVLEFQLQHRSFQWTPRTDLF